MISPEAISIQPYGIMLRKGDPAFKKVADNAIIAVFKSGEINKIYAKWFLSPIPPKNINLNVPMSDAAEEGDREPDGLRRSGGLQVMRPAKPRVT